MPLIRLPVRNVASSGSPALRSGPMQRTQSRSAGEPDEATLGTGNLISGMIDARSDANPDPNLPWD
jgi:hypothetical protein